MYIHLNNERRTTTDNFCRNLSERTVLNAHNLNINEGNFSFSVCPSHYL